VADETDAAERLADLDGIVWVDTLDGEEDDADDADDDDDVVDGYEDEDEDEIEVLDDEVEQLEERVEALEELVGGEGLDDGSEPLESELDEDAGTAVAFLAPEADDAVDPEDDAGLGGSGEDRVV
jgi:hypothetical protein